jgi:hypothetical protein
MLPALLLSLLFAGNEGQLDRKVGLLSTFGSGCLMIRNDSLPPGTPLTSLGGPKTVVLFQTAAKLAHTCDREHLPADEEGISYYSVSINGKLAETDAGEWLVFAGTARKSGASWVIGRSACYSQRLLHERIGHLHALERYAAEIDPAIPVSTLPRLRFGTQLHRQRFGS